METNLNKGLILGISGGIIVFIIALMLIMFNNSDFDQQLINQVDNGVPTDKLIPEIDKETEKMKQNAQRRLESNVINKNINKNDSESYMQSYKDEMKMISEYDDARKEFAKREITKEQFLNDIETHKNL